MKVLTWTFVLALQATTAAAQITPQPIPRVVADVRAFYAGLERDPVTAADLGLLPEELPSRGLGLVGGVHVHPFRRQRFALGIGGEGLLARGRAQATDETGTAIGPLVTQKLRGLAVVFSLNFGGRNGWSYLSAGTGPFVFASYLDDPPADAPPSQMTLNLGGGARWFATGHLAFGFDARFYQTQPEVSIDGYAARERRQLFILSAGVSFR